MDMLTLTIKGIRDAARFEEAKRGARRCAEEILQGEERYANVLGWRDVAANAAD